MGHLEDVLSKVKEKISEYREEVNEVEDPALKQVKQVVSKYDRVIDAGGEVEDWYHDVGARGAFKSK